MKKIIVMVVVFIFMLTGCGGNQNASSSNVPEKESVEEPIGIDHTIDAVAEHLELSNKAEVYYNIIEAEDGAEYNDGAIELYMFSVDSDAYKKIINGKGAIKAEAYNDGFVLVVPEGTEADKVLIDKFKEISFK